MKKSTTLFILLSVITFCLKAQVSVISIDSARMTNAIGDPLDSGLTVQLTGVVYGPNQYPTENGMAFFLNDHVAGIKIYSKHVYAGYAALTDGDSIVVIGTLSSYHGAAEVDLDYTAPLDTIYKVGTGHIDTPVVTPVVILGAQTYGFLVQIDNIDMSAAANWGAVAGKHNFTANSGGLYMYIDSFMNAAMYNAPQPQGTYNVVGFGDQYTYSPPFTSGYQIDPRSLSDFHLVTASGINQINNRLTAAIYPNPAATLLTVIFNDEKDETVTAKFYDITGREAMTTTQAVFNGLNTLEFNVGGFSEGLYFLELNAGEKSLVTKIIIAR